MGRQFAMRILTILVLGALLPLMHACASAPSRPRPVPETLADSVGIPGIPRARSWGDAPPPDFGDWHRASDQELMERFSGIMDREHSYLAISGGGDDGAFGAGLLVGWTAAGTRPEFTIVTGISTGALTAPFAFLGPAYDNMLEEVYTKYSTRDLVEKRGRLATLRGDAAGDAGPLRELIARYVDGPVMQAIANEHRKGRLLLIGTTNIDAARPVIWNIGRIAASGQPGALDLIRDIMLASASIPGAFPPVSIEVEAQRQRYDELHVDGGATSQVFLYPLEIDWRLVEQRLRVRGVPKVYIIRNAYLSPRWKTVERRFGSIMGRTVSSLIRTQGLGDLYRIYLGTLRDGLEFNLAYVPDDIGVRPSEDFDPIYMQALFERGYALAKDGHPWTAVPPGLDPDHAAQGGMGRLNTK